MPSPDSMAKLRCVASTVEKRTASQKSPGAAAWSAVGSGTEGEGEEDEDEQGERQHLPERDPRAQLRCAGPCHRRAARHATCVLPPRSRRTAAWSRDGGQRPAGHRRSSPTRPPTMVTTRSASGTASSGSCDESSTAAPPATASATSSASRSRAAGVEPGVRLVEQPQPRAAGDERRQRHPPALAGREPADLGPPQPAGQTEPLEGRVDPVGRPAGRPHREPDVLRRASARRRAAPRGRAGRPRRRTAVRSSRRSWPSTDASPDVTASRPAQVRSRLVLPAPFGPTTTTTSPMSTERSTPERAGNRPASATAERRWTAGAMTFPAMLRGSGRPNPSRGSAALFPASRAPARPPAALSSG